MCKVKLAGRDAKSGQTWALGVRARAGHGLDYSGLDYSGLLYALDSMSYCGKAENESALSSNLSDKVVKGHVGSLEVPFAINRP